MLAKKAYEFGIDAIIVQDLGLARYLIKNFPNLPIHASTQMTIHNLEGALEAEKLGFKRVVLSRELSLAEIEYICSHTTVEIETFIHGALCISYSGQCLFSSMVGGRSRKSWKMRSVLVGFLMNLLLLLLWILLLPRLLLKRKNWIKVIY